MKLPSMNRGQVIGDFAIHAGLLLEVELRQAKDNKEGEKATDLPTKEYISYLSFHFNKAVVSH